MRYVRRSRLLSFSLITTCIVLTYVGLPYALDHADQPDPDSIVLAKLHHHLAKEMTDPSIPPMELAHHLLDVATAYRLNPFVLLGLIKTESSYNPRARSSVGALGLTQMMPAMIRHYGMTPASFLACVRCQLELAARHLLYLMNRFDGRQDLALLSYHGSLTPSQSRYILRIHRTAQQSAQSPEPHSLTWPAPHRTVPQTLPKQSDRDMKSFGLVEAPSPS